jgi:hypothetical protein
MRGGGYERNRRVPGARRLFPRLGPFVRSVGPDKDLRKVTRDHVQAFVSTRAAGVSPVTTTGDFACVCAFLRAQDVCLDDHGRRLTYLRRGVTIRMYLY